MSSYPLELKVHKTANPTLASINLVYVNPTLAPEPDELFLLDGHFLYHPAPHDSVPAGAIALSSAQREFMNRPAGGATPVVVDTVPRRNIEPILAISLRVEMISMDRLEVDANELKQWIRDVYDGFPFNNRQPLVIRVGQDEDAMLLKLIVEELSMEDRGPHGLLADSTEIALSSDSNRIALMNNSALKKDLSLEALGIGGLKKEFEIMFRRAFVQRSFDPEIIRGLGISHVKGLILHGPPGTGKTLIARQLGAVLDSRPPKIVNGPEILNKYVGQSEENIRNLFKDAEEEYALKGEKSQLHMIIFDEIDAICKKRGSDGSAGVGDQVVNQLLSKIDGIQRLNNILVVGLTNRLDLIDDALLRPGRFEIHLEISLPDERARYEIFKIHTKKMSGNNYLDKSVDLDVLAQNTKNYTGAEIEAVVRAACGYALERKAGLNRRVMEMGEEAAQAEEAPPKTEDEILVTGSDFLDSLRDVRPAFGVSEDETELANKVFYETATTTSAIALGSTMLGHLKETNLYTTTSLLFYGGMNTGKTTLAVKLALQSGFPFVKLISPDHLVGMPEYEKVNHIKKCFLDASKSEEACVILDDLEAIMEYVPIGPRFSNLILQAIKRFVKAEKKKKLFVFGTTSAPEFIQDCGIFDCFTESFEVGSCTQEEYEELCRQNEAFREVPFLGPTPIRRLITSLPFADTRCD